MIETSQDLFDLRFWSSIPEALDIVRLPRVIGMYDSHVTNMIASIMIFMTNKRFVITYSIAGVATYWKADLPGVSNLEVEQSHLAACQSLSL